MSGSNAKIEWYLARDGQQHGPLSDPELKKFIELGHLNPSDLVWRAGFPEWRTASEVFPETKPEVAAAAKQESQQRTLGEIESARAEAKKEDSTWAKAPEAGARTGVASDNDKAGRGEPASAGNDTAGQFSQSAAPEPVSQQPSTNSPDTDLQPMQPASTDTRPAAGEVGASKWS